MLLQTISPAAQTDIVTIVIYLHSVSREDEARTSGTAGEIKGMYERAPCHGRNHW